MVTAVELGFWQTFEILPPMHTPSSFFPPKAWTFNIAGLKDEMASVVFTVCGISRIFKSRKIGISRFCIFIIPSGTMNVSKYSEPSLTAPI